jgi:hypothetical protein
VRNAPQSGSLLKLFIKRLQIYFYRPQRLVVGCAFALFTFFALTFGWIQTTKFAKRKINHAITAASKKLNMPLDVKDIRVSLAGALLENIVVGADANVVISKMNVEVGINPFSENFGKLDNLTVHNIRIKAPTENAEQAIKDLQKESKKQKQSQAEKVNNLITKFFSSLPTNSLTFRSAGVSLVNANGKPVFTSKGIKLHINKLSKKVLFRADSVSMTGGISEKNLQGRFQYSVRKNQFQFFVKRKSRPIEGKELWSFSGNTNQELSSLSLKIHAKYIPSFITERLAKVTGPITGMNLTANIQLDKTPKGELVFGVAAKSDGMVINNPVISTDAVGHIRYMADAKGVISGDLQSIKVSTFKIQLPQRNTGKYTESSPKIKGHVNATLTNLKPVEFKVDGQLAMESAPCQAVIDASPKGLTPNLDEFILSGSMAAALKFRLDTLRPDDLYFDVYDSSFDCQVIKAPYSFTKEHLNGAFTLQRYVKGLSEPIEVSVNPFSSDYTPIESIAKTVNLALVTSEDNAFFNHKGIDLFALENAIHRNFKEKRIAVGGSTITMQTVKNLYLGNERTISRKFQEFFLAWHLEKILDKNRILEIYMNIVEFGPGVYGITNASQHFFGKHPFDLNLVESAYLATVLPSPKGRYHNFCNGRLSAGFKDLVYGLLKRMLNLNRIPYERYASAMGIQLEFNNRSRQTTEGCQNSETDDL